MTNSKDNKPKTTLEDGDITSGRSETRRSFLKRSGVAGLAAIGVAATAQRTAAADAVGAGSDNDVNDPYGGGSDNDVNDPYGGGSDYDTNQSGGSDPAGYGSDSDPNDAAGYGTDSD